MAEGILLCIDPRYQPRDDGAAGEFEFILEKFIKEHGIKKIFCLKYPGASLAVNDPDHYQSIKKTLQFITGHGGVDTLNIFDHTEVCAAFVQKYGEMKENEEVEAHIAELKRAQEKINADFPNLNIPLYYHDSDSLQKIA